jgi:hypothetical protein
LRFSRAFSAANSCSAFPRRRTRSAENNTRSVARSAAGVVPPPHSRRHYPRAPKLRS